MLQKVFGANVDWISQHSVFPEYFRQQFYETGALFPEFAANIGGGRISIILHTMVFIIRSCSPLISFRL